MDAESVLSELVAGGCRFVVVGSTARRLIDEPALRPNDLDIVVPRDRASHLDLTAALRRVGGHVPRGDAPWAWGFRTTTTAGPVDVVVRFVDGTDHAHHDAHAVDIEIAGGVIVRCHPTRHAT